MKDGALGFRTVGQKLRILIIVVPVLVMVAGSIFNYYLALWSLHGGEVQRCRTAVDSGAKALDGFFDRDAMLPRCIAARQRALPSPSSAAPDTQDILLAMLESAAAPHCNGLYIAFEGVDPKKGGVQVVDRKDFKDAKVEYNHNDPDKKVTRWYHGAKALWEEARHPRGKGGPSRLRHYYVGEPIFDRGGANELLVSITQPVVDRDGGLIGVAGVDLKCDSLITFLNANFRLPRGDGQVEGRTGRFVAFYLSPENKIIARTDVPAFEHPEDEPLSFEREFRVEMRDDQSPPDGCSVVYKGKKCRLFWKTADDSGWKFALIVPETELDLAASRMAVSSARFGWIFPAIMVLLAWLAAGWLTGPIPRLTSAAEAVEAGDYRAEGLGSIASRKDEFGQLARGFQRMVGEVSTREGQLRQAQEEILNRERHFRSLIENGSDVIAVIDRDGVIRYESPSIRRVLGYEPEELVGSPRFDLVHPDDVEKVAAAFERRVRGLPIDSVVEYRVRHKDGSWRRLEAISTNLLDDPAVEGIVVNSRDVTERVRAQDELDDLRRRQAEELEKRVRIRTAELAQKNEELKAANEAIDQAMKLQEVFLSNVAHDLRTPLTIVIGYSQDLLRKAKKKGQDAFIPDLNLIVNKGQELLELINDLLNASKAMNEKEIGLDLKRFEVAPMIVSRTEGIGAISQKRGNTIELRLAPDLGAMFADESKVWRILMNLLTNSCKFTEKGTITLHAERVARGSGDRLVFRVVDTGKGMDPEQQARLFARFSQVHSSSGKMQAGVGLGLSICQLYCRAMGGTITVASQVGVGTEFRVDLPAEVRERPAAPPAKLAWTAPEAPPPPELGDRANLVLIIDDDISVCELMRRNLGEEGIPSFAAHTGEDGLRLAKQLHPSAIILDVLMPGIDGWAVLAALKTDSEMSNIPILMASMLDEKERGLRMGADDFVSKPLGHDRLAEFVRKHGRGHATGKILYIEDGSEAGPSLAGSLREQGWEVREATEGAEAIAHLAEGPPDLILLDLMAPDRGGMSLLAEIRGHDVGQSIPIIVITSADLDADARRRLQGQVEKVLTTGVFGRDDLLREVRSLVASPRREPSSHPIAR